MKIALPYVLQLLKEDERTDIYLGAPYSHPCKEYQRSRVDQINWAAMTLIDAGFIVFSPISHSHPIALMRPETQNDHDLWLHQDEAFMLWADAMVVLELPGHWESKGLDYEYESFRKQQKPVVFISPEEIYDLNQALRVRRLQERGKSNA
jgi:nucleoside 2-deoxyribosyltransferase